MKRLLLAAVIVVWALALIPIFTAWFYYFGFSTWSILAAVALASVGAGAAYARLC